MAYSDNICCHGNSCSHGNSYGYYYSNKFMVNTSVHLQCF